MSGVMPLLSGVVTLAPAAIKAFRVNNLVLSKVKKMGLTPCSLGSSMDILFLKNNSISWKRLRFAAIWMALL